MPDTATQNAPKFVHLHMHSAYSLAEGAMHPKEIVAMCQKLGMPAAAITDTNNMFGGLEFALAASKGGVQPIIGCQLSFGHEKHQLVFLVQNEQGYRNLCALVSRAYLEDKEQTEAQGHWEDLEQFNEGLICLSGGVKGPICQYLLHNQPKEADNFVKKLNKLFKERFYIEIQRHEGVIEETRTEDALIDLAYKHNIPLVATNDCYFSDKEMHEAHDALLCIAEGRYVTEADRRKATPDHYFKSEDEMVELFSDLPEAVQNTVAIAQRCSYLLKPIDPILPPFDTEGGRNEIEELKAQAKEGLEWRLKNFVENWEDKDVQQPYWDRLDFELSIIEQMGFPGYFLIVSDFIKWAKEQDIPVGPGRGSGAGSVVAWGLKITDLDPLRFNLLFERFLNPERVSMPDFDVDFCQDRRDEVIRYVQEKYGYDHVAQIITFGKLQARAVVRDVGRVLQMPYGQVDRIAKMIPNNPAAPVTLQEALDQDKDLRDEVSKEETSQKLIDIALKLEGLYRHASTHAAGVVIGDRPLHELIPLYRDPRSDMPVTQFNMKYVEQAGLVKFDFLGLKTLTVVKKAVEYIKASKGDEIDILKIPLDDRKTYELLSDGMGVGVFQLESSGMRDVLKKLRPDRFEDIIALVSLYRPGPMDNIPRYINIKEEREDADYMHPILQPILEETFGIMIYQEQVMQAAQQLAGYSLGGADLLRRAMGKKIKEAMDAEREKFVKGAKEHHNVPKEKSEEIFEQIAKFAGYGFNKSHAAAYALIAYQTGWLKANYPVEFMAASMTLDKGNTDKLAIFKQDLDRMKLPLYGPDVNISGPDFQVEGEGIRYALAALKGVGTSAMHVLVEERKKNKFNNLYNFVERVSSLNKKQLEMLSAAGALDSLNNNRAQNYAAAEMLLRHGQNIRAEKESGQNSLFGGDSGADIALSKPPLPDMRDWDHLDRLANEFSAVGFFLSAHPLDGREKQLNKLHIVSFIDLEDKMMTQSAARVQMAGILLKKQEKISSKSGKKYAFLQLSDSTGVYEVMIFSEALAFAREFLIEGTAILLTVDAEIKDDQMRMVAQMVTLLDEAVDGSIRQSDIIISEVNENLSQLKENLIISDGEDDVNAVKLSLIIPINETLKAKLALPELYSFSAQNRRKIENIDGIEKIIVH